ncbi:uncharacterized protein K452DRAFT_72672 [Neofusicoccum parvum]|nr:uncharacterized protein K452DRAFT_72672 [Neofusicoccum parvum]
MSPTEPSARRTHACDECKRRKVRCSGHEPCRNCQRDAKACCYSSPLHTIRQLERRLSRCNKLLQNVQVVWRAYVPDTSLEDALQQLTPDAAQSPSLPVSPIQSICDTELSRADDFEFDESRGFPDLVDGMGSLTVEPHRAGYMGTESGSAALRFLHDLTTYTPQLRISTRSDEDESVASALAGPSEVNRLLDDYFALYHPAYPLLHEATFRAQVSGAVAKPRDGSWPLLYNIVLAIGSFVGASGSGRHDIQLYQAARTHLTTDILEKGSLPLVQSLTLMGNYLQKRNKPNTGFNILGIAVNMALAIGLHREFDLSRTTPFVMELRRRTWWTLFVFESGARLTLGRSAAALSGVTIELPANIDDSDLAVDIDSIPPPQDKPTVTSCLRAQVGLAKIANTAHSKLLATGILRSSEVLQQDTQVRNWLASLPPYFAPASEWCSTPKMVLLWRAAHLRIIISRPSLFAAIRSRTQLAITSAADQRAPPSPTSVCVSTADECTASICRFWASSPPPRRTRGLAWYAAYWLTTAAVVLATCLAYDATHALAPRWRAQLVAALATLGELGDLYDMARRAREILREYVGAGGIFEERTASGAEPDGARALADLETTLDAMYADTLPLEVMAVPGFDSFDTELFLDGGWPLVED